VDGINRLIAHIKHFVTVRTSSKHPVFYSALDPDHQGSQLCPNAASARMLEAAEDTFRFRACVALSFIII